MRAPAVEWAHSSSACEQRDMLTHQNASPHHLCTRHADGRLLNSPPTGVQTRRAYVVRGVIYVCGKREFHFSHPEVTAPPSWELVMPWNAGLGPHVMMSAEGVGAPPFGPPCRTLGPTVTKAKGRGEGHVSNRGTPPGDAQTMCR